MTLYAMFQFLIGKIQTGRLSQAQTAQKQFQFLIGKIQTEEYREIEQQAQAGFNSS